MDIGWERARHSKVGGAGSNICTLLALIVLAWSKACNEHVTDGVSSVYRGPWRECKPVEDSLFTSRDVGRDPGSTTHGNNSQRAAIQSHAFQRRKHLAVYRKRLMKECCGYLDAAAGDDFSWFLRFLTTDRNSLDMCSIDDGRGILSFPPSSVFLFLFLLIKVIMLCRNCQQVASQLWLN